jgi:dTDP-4-amino-4,6-dideoxygalactose transaminase
VARWRDAVTNSPWKIPLSDLAVDDELADAAREAVASGWWSMGPRVAEFEEHFASFVGARHALAVANGTAALHLALLACDCGPGDEVVLPSLNFVASANVVMHVGATPVFVDVCGGNDLNLDPADVARVVSNDTKALVVLHYGGVPCDLTAIGEIAAAYGLRVIEDAAHALGTRWKGRMCGTLGDVGCFSFFSNKNLPIGEGGMLVTNDDELARQLRLLRSHGMTTLTWDRHRGHAHSYDVVAHGLNYRLDEIRAAIALVQLRRLPAANAARAHAAAAYERALAGTNIDLAFRGVGGSAHHLTVAILPEPVSRRNVQESMRERGIQTSVHYPPIHRFTAFADGRPELPRTDDLAARIVTLPLYPGLSADDVTAVADALIAAVAAAGSR